MPNGCSTTISIGLKIKHTTFSYMNYLSCVYSCVSTLVEGAVSYQLQLCAYIITPAQMDYGEFVLVDNI